MKTRFTILLAACATVMAACSKVDTCIPAGGDGTMEVSLGLPLITGGKPYGSRRHDRRNDMECR